jgi:hypothetical protein
LVAELAPTRCDKYQKNKKTAPVIMKEAAGSI